MTKVISGFSREIHLAGSLFVIFFAVMAVTMNYLVLERMLEISTAVLFPEEIFSLWALTIVINIVLTILVLKKAWKWR